MSGDELKTITEKLAVPFYEDALRPFSKEVSKGLVSIAKIVNSGVFLIEDCTHTVTNVLRMAAENLSLLPQENISFEKPRIALQALNESKFAINELEIQQLFANLISSSLNNKTVHETHPAYVEIIKQLQPDEALFLQFMYSQEKHRSGHAPTIDITNTGGGGDVYFSTTISEVNLVCEDAGCANPENSVSYVSNLKRIGLITANSSGTSFQKEAHERIFSSDKAKKLIEFNPHLEKQTYTSGQFSFTGFGGGFVKTCIGTKNCT